VKELESNLSVSNGLKYGDNARYFLGFSKTLHGESLLIFEFLLLMTNTLTGSFS